MPLVARILTGLAGCCMAAALCPGAEAPKQRSALYPRQFIERAQANAAKYPWAARLRDGILERARPWMGLSDNQLWDMMFGPAITRSHMVWSSGFCPACRQPVPMYDWEIDAWKHPWKVRCPRCQQFFPKNDFHAFYRSGLDQHGGFDPGRADRSLLVNTEHPDPADPLHRFGVDDGEGYTEGDNRWRFIGAYLLYGQFRQLVLDGIVNLAAAYMVSGDAAYAHKAGVLLDRVADLWPGFDYAEQGLVYERRKYGGGVAGYVGYAIASAFDVRKLALAYDQVFEALRADPELIRFLADKAARFRLPNPKTTFALVQSNIEGRILRDALARPEKIRTNYPGTEATLALLRTVLEWPASRPRVMAEIDGIVARSTAVDGLSGEKGLTGYATIAPRFLAEFLEQYARADPRLLPELLERHPKLRRTYRFFVDTWCGRQYYPYSGDAGSFAVRQTQYVGASFAAGGLSSLLAAGLPSSAYSFFWRLYQATRDPLYLQIVYLVNGETTEGLPHDLFAADPEAVARDVRRTIARAGPLPHPGSVNLREWHLAILRSPRDPSAAVWLDYDSVPASGIKGHIHYDAMNLGLYAKGLDLLPEFGYPAVQFGDWHTPQARWHTMTAAHNTVVVDGANQAGGEGRTTLWADGTVFRAVRASSPEQIRGQRYERTVAMVDLPERDFYVLDVFRVSGGSDHARFLHSHFADLSTEGLTLRDAPDYGHNTLMRRFFVDPNPQPGWTATWKIEDRLGYLPQGAEVRLRHTDLTRDAQAYTCERWTVRNLTSTEQFWIPAILTRRQTSQGPLTSTFVAVLEPYERTPRLRSIRRLDLETADGRTLGDAHVAIELTLDDGRRDVWIAADVEDPVNLIQERTHRIQLRGEMAFARWNPAGKIELLAAAGAELVRAGDVTLKPARKTDFVERPFPPRGQTEPSPRFSKTPR